MDNFTPDKCFFEQEHGNIAIRKSSACHRCGFCQLDIPFAEWFSHEKGKMHKASLKAMKHFAADQLLLYKRRIEALSWESRISKLHPASTQVVYQAMLDYVTDCRAENTAVTVLLGKCESIERVVLITS
jgi:hypothetical protein